MAYAAGIDPLEFRLNNTKDPRMLATLKAVAEAYGWEPTTGPRKDGRGRGLACGIDAETYVALIADVAGGAGRLRGPYHRWGIAEMAEG